MAKVYMQMLHCNMQARMKAARYYMRDVVTELRIHVEAGLGRLQVRGCLADVALLARSCPGDVLQQQAEMQHSLFDRAARWRMVGRVPASCLVPAYRVAVLSTACIARRNVALPASHRKSQNEESSETGRLQAS